MNIFPRKPKTILGHFYFGDFDEKPLAPFSISVATFDASHDGEPKHYHTHNQKAYITLIGKGLINISGKSVELTPNQMIHIEPNEVHFIEKVIESPMQIVVVLASKTDDRVVVD